MKLSASFFILCLFCIGCSSSEKNISVSGKTATFFQNPTIEKKVDSLLSLMTQEEKIGQLSLYTSHFDVTGPSTPKQTEDMIRKGQVGAIFNAFTASHNAYLQRIAVEESRLGIPLLFGYDIIHGFRTIFPINLGMSCTWDTLLVEQTAHVAALEGSAAGLKWTFSPMCDITRDPRWGRVSEGSGEDALLSSKIGAAMVRGYQGQDITSPTSLLSCVKHFAGYGAPQAGRDYHTVDMTDRSLREVYLPAYKAALDAGSPTVMTAFNEIDGTPATASHYLFTDILRHEWGFRGFVVTDYTAIMEILHHGVAKDSLDATASALNAGVNMDMESDFYRKFLLDAVKKGKVEQWQIDQMCREVLRIKYYAGLFDSPYQNTDTIREKTAFLRPEYLELSRDVARKSCVLLQNENAVLPLSEKKHIAVIGPLADSKDNLLGSWRAAGDTTMVTSILEALKERYAKVSFSRGCALMGDDKRGFAAAMAVAKKADAVVMVCGESCWWTGEAASVTEITLPAIQVELIKAI
ncbi:MAG: glycoside hydrolase family 3 N-terminal domain-containing protein, partial [Flavobacteriales bacterium]|nr:glycoside hydrolase family 3 N-terminal domain-containing protein [Flavobacteriales bacterium]